MAEASDRIAGVMLTMVAGEGGRDTGGRLATLGREGGTAARAPSWQQLRRMSASPSDSGALRPTLYISL